MNRTVPPPRRNGSRLTSRPCASTFNANAAAGLVPSGKAT